MIVAYLSQTNPDIEWDWNAINASDIHFPSSFAWGTATAAHQVEGNNTNNNWHVWERSVDEKGISRIHENDTSGIAADHWNRYPEDIKLMKELGLTHYRFSVEWSKVEPSLGQIDYSVIEHYKDLCDSLILNDITPVVTPVSYTHLTLPTIYSV